MGTTGVISIQGDFSKHLEVLSRIGAQAKEIREPRDLAGVDRVILPGGESTTVGMLMQRWGLAEALVERVRSGIPIWGTCMGMILMATEIEDREQFSVTPLYPKSTRLRMLCISSQSVGRSLAFLFALRSWSGMGRMLRFSPRTKGRSSLCVRETASGRRSILN